LSLFGKLCNDPFQVVKKKKAILKDIYVKKTEYTLKDLSDLG
jgi:hypothetical protein